MVCASSATVTGQLGQRCDAGDAGQHGLHSSTSLGIGEAAFCSGALVRWCAVRLRAG